MDIIKQKEHLIPEGLRKVIALKASINLGLSDVLKSISRSNTRNKTGGSWKKISSPSWLAGFIEAEGCFHVAWVVSKEARLGVQIRLEFSITQNIRDSQLMESFKEYLDWGTTRTNRRDSTILFSVSRLADVVDKVIPFIEKYPLHGVKALDFEDFKKK